MNNLVASPACFHLLELDEALLVSQRLGFSKFEVFTGWVKSAFDIERDPKYYIEKAKQYDLRFTSFHLPPIEEDVEKSIGKVIKAARFAKAIGAEIVIYKAINRAKYIEAAKPFLNAIEEIGLIPVIQNHCGSSIQTIDDYREVLEGINDSRLMAILEQGHFHKAGISWMEGYNFLKDRIALLHIKDMKGTESVTYGEGEVDLSGLFNHMKSVGYKGDFVVEIERNTLENVAKSVDYLKKIYDKNFI